METETNAGKRILLVEDERVTRELIKELLVQDRHIVVEANNGAEAFALFRNGGFDLVMLILAARPPLSPGGGIANYGWGGIEPPVQFRSTLAYG